MELYRNCSFDGLLADGRISEAIQLRLETLEQTAHETRIDLEASKFINGGTMIAGAVLAFGNPVIGLLAAFSAGAYGYSLFKDYMNTRRLCPLPGVRSSISDMLNRKGQEEDPLMLTLGYLSPSQAAEYEVLFAREAEFTRFLSAFRPEQRLAAYRFALRHAQQMPESLPLPTVETARGAIVVPETIALTVAQSEPMATIAPVDTTSADERAIVLPATQVQPAAAPTDSRPPTPIATPATPLPACPMRYLIGDRLRTALIVSVSGGGKDILLSNALRAFLAAYPAFRVVVADCKDDPKEYGYYDGLPNVSVHRLNVAVASDGEVIQWVDGWVTEFVHLPEKALLICNEGTLIRAKSKRYVQAVDGLVSSGDSREKYAWEAGQSGHTDDLQINGAARSRFRTLIIGLKGEEMQIEAVLSAKFVADSARNMNDIRAQMMRSPVSRAWCDGQAWYAMPKLENYSGYDRDTRSHLAGFATPDQRHARAKLEGLYRETGEMNSEMISEAGEMSETISDNSRNGETDAKSGDSAAADDSISDFISERNDFVSGEIDPDRVRRVLEMKRNEMKQTQIIAIEWGAKAGDNQPYKDAVAEYKAIIDNHWKE